MFTPTYTPPPVRVVIDSIREPKGALIAGAAADRPRAGRQQGAGDRRGGPHVVCSFDDDPVLLTGTSRSVFVANGVAHLPVVVPSRS